MTNMSELELTVKHTISASREKVFNAWLSPENLAQFMRTAKDGLPSPKVQTDPVKGGRFLIVMVTPEKEIRIRELIWKSIPIPACPLPGNRPIHWMTASSPSILPNRNQTRQKSP